MGPEADFASESSLVTDCSVNNLIFNLKKIMNESTLKTANYANFANLKRLVQSQAKF
jgi:hypothetical protein